MRARHLALGLVALFLAAASTGVAQIPMSAHVVPVVVKAPGAGGSNWLADLFVTNLGTTTATFSAHYFKSGSANTFNGTFAKANVNLAAGQTLKVTDVVGYWFPSAGTNTKGWLFIADTKPVNCSDDNRVGAKLAVSTRVYNAAGGGGTFGQIVESAWSTTNTSTFPSVFTGIRNGGTAIPGFRTNVGVANLSAVTITVEFKLFKLGGAQLGGAIRKDIPALSLLQWDLQTLGLPVSTEGGGRLEVALVNANYDPCVEGQTAPSCMNRCETQCNAKYGFGTQKVFIAYASNVDNKTGDGENLLPVIDWAAFNEWSNSYKNAHCPSRDDIEALSRAARRFGFDLRRDPTFFKIEEEPGRP
ncbi:MAG: hypothetical protein AB2L07_02480 [Thermoanaerobaculaceae bacterium]